MSDTELFPIPGSVKSSAVLSACGKYRYSLTREWDRSLPRVCFCLLNPSTADAEKDDPTSRRGMGFARSLGFGSMVFVNAFAFRATNPAVILSMGREAITEPNSDGGFPFSNLNNHHIIANSENHRLIVAWGCDGTHLGRDKELKELLKHRRVECMGRTKDGQPKHLLYLKSDLKPIPFPIAGISASATA